MWQGGLKEGMELSCRFLSILTFGGIGCHSFLSLPGVLSVGSAFIGFLSLQVWASAFSRLLRHTQPSALLAFKPGLASRVLWLSSLLSLWPHGFSCLDSSTVIREGFQEEAEMNAYVPSTVLTKSPSHIFFKEKDRSQTLFLPE